MEQDAYYEAEANQSANYAEYEENMQKVSPKEILLYSLSEYIFQTSGSDLSPKGCTDLAEGILSFLEDKIRAHTQAL